MLKSSLSARRSTCAPEEFPPARKNAWRLLRGVSYEIDPQMDADLRRFGDKGLETADHADSTDSIEATDGHGLTRMATTTRKSRFCIAACPISRCQAPGVRSAYI